MNKKWNSIALVSCLLTVGVHIYLSLHYYQLKFGFLSGPSVCNISSLINCDSVTASPYSAIFGIPVALFGLVTHLILFLFLLVSRWNLVEQAQWLKKSLLGLAGFILLASIVMGSLSILKVGQICIFCVAAYILSLLTFTAVFLEQKKSEKSPPAYLMDLFTSQKWISLSLLSIPLLAFLFHSMFLSNYGVENIGRQVQEKVGYWQNAPVEKFTDEGLLLQGSEKTSTTLVEFADYRCPHCKMAAPGLIAFAKAHPDVKFVFKPFPLDGTCNKAIPNGDGFSCQLAYLSLCAEKLGQKGWETHELIFDLQEEIHQSQNTEALTLQIAKTFKLNAEALKKCISEEDIQSLVRRTAAEGEAAKVQGTPAVFVNGKLLNGGQFLPVLEGAYKAIKSQ
ncbi:MAG: DsbA family protein [Pseudobdellovibrionaceae bacterium]